jgi:hypothetical protein
MVMLVGAQRRFLNDSLRQSPTNKGIGRKKVAGSPSHRMLISIHEDRECQRNFGILFPAKKRIAFEMRLYQHRHLSLSSHEALLFIITVA